MRFELQSSNLYKTYTRTDYNILQFIGDVGALYQTLRDLIGIFLSFFLRYEFYLSAHLINNVFARRQKSSEKLYPRHHLQLFRTLCCNICKFKTKRRELNHISTVASRRIDRELDIIYFLKKQMMLSAVINALTSKNQRVLARRNYRFKINSRVGGDLPSDVDSTTESGNEYVDQETSNQDDDRVTKTLYEDRHRKSKKQEDTP